AAASFPAASPVADRARPMAETQEMWSRRDNRSNQRTDLAYCIAWSKHGLRPVKSRNSPLKNSSTEARSISAVISIYSPWKAHHSPMVSCTPRRFEVYLLDRLAW